MRPNVQTEDITPDIRAMQSRFAELWTALATFAADKTSANLTTMIAKAVAAESAADNVGDNYNGSPLENPADILENAADDAQNLTTSSSAAAIEAICKPSSARQTILPRPWPTSSVRLPA